MAHVYSAAVQVTAGTTDIDTLADYERDNWRKIVHRLTDMGELVLAGHIASGYLAGDDYPVAASAHNLGHCHLCQCIERLTDAENGRAPIGAPVAYAEYACRKARPN